MMSRWLRRLLPLIAGLGLVVFVLRGVDARRVAELLWQAGPWLPLVLVLEVAQAFSDFGALRVLLGARAHTVPAWTWIRSSAMAYGLMILLPAGRAAGEIARATLLAKHVGPSSAATAAAQLQAAYVFGNGVASAAACAVVATWLGPRASLAGLLAGNTVIMFATATALLTAVSSSRVGKWIERLRRWLRVPPDSSRPDPRDRRKVPWLAGLICAAGRCAQLLQYGVILMAVGGNATLRGAFVAHGIHLVGATLGDMFPNQLGVVDGTYRAFAWALGLARTPERALSIALMVHLAQIGMASVCIVVGSLMGTAHPGPRASRASAGAGARS